jgi:xylulokinase
MHGAVMLDDTGKVVRPALIWCDVRTNPQCRELTEKIGAQQIIEATCNPALANFTLTKLMWVREHEPENWKRVRSIMLPKDYVRFRITGERAIDMADASGTLLLDVAHRVWSKLMLQAGEIDERSLPALFESPDVCGKVSPEGAAALGLSAGTPVVAGAGDQAATDRPALEPGGRLHTFCHAIPGRWHVMGVTQAAGLSLRWFRDQFGAGVDDGRDPYERLSDEAAKIPAGCQGLLWTPYLMGERTPHLDPNARAALVGLTASHTRAHVIRSIMEGVAFSLRDTFTLFNEMKVAVNKIRLGGGGARSPLWRQIQADVYGHEVEIVEAEEGAAYGAAILAGVGAGTWKSVDEACAAVVKVATAVAPQPDAVKVMNTSYIAYRRVYPATREIFAS